MQQFGPLQQAPPLGQAEYVEVYSAVPPPAGLKKLVKKQGVARGANIQYDKSRTPGADTMNKQAEDTSTYGRYGVASREIPERAEGAKYGSGYGYKSFASKSNVQKQIALDKASRVPSSASVEFQDLGLDEQETPDSVIGSAIALLLGMVVGSSITYIVARPRFQSKKMGSPEPLLTSIV